MEKRRSTAAAAAAAVDPWDDAKSSSSSSGIIPIVSSSVTPQRRTLNFARNGAFAALQQQEYHLNAIDRRHYVGMSSTINAQDNVNTILSSRQNHCDSSHGSSNEFRTVLSGPIQPTWAVTPTVGCYIIYHCLLLGPKADTRFTISQRLSQPRHCSKGVHPSQSCVWYRSSFCGKHATGPWWDLTHRSQAYYHY